MTEATGILVASKKLDMAQNDYSFIKPGARHVDNSSLKLEMYNRGRKDTINELDDKINDILSKMSSPLDGDEFQLVFFQMWREFKNWPDK